MSTTGYAHLDTNGYVPSSELIGGATGILASITGVDLKTTGQTTLYTVPAGKTLVLTDVIALATTASTITIAPIVRIGKASSYNEWLPLTTLTGLDTTNKFTSLGMSAALLMHQTFAAGEVVKIDVQTGSTATTLTVTLHLLGFLV